MTKPALVEHSSRAVSLAHYSVFLNLLSACKQALHLCVTLSNVALCSRLESKLDELKSATTEDGDRHLLEHLFFCSDAAHLQRLAEESFPRPPSQPLSNSLTLALQEGMSDPGLQRGAAAQTRHVMVCKVLMSHCCKAS